MKNHTEPITFNEVVEKYLKYSQANKQSKKKYQNILYKHWIANLGELPISEINNEMILDILFEKELSDKYINQILIPLRGVFETAIMLKYITENPTSHIKNRKIQTELPDPFTKQELEIILQHLKENYHKTYYLFYELAFWTGLRPCEILPLTRQEVIQDRLYIHKTKMDGIEKRTTKTKQARYVLLNKRAYQAIQQLGQGYLFINPETDRPFYSNKQLRIAFNKTLIHTGIRIRPSYNTRHTYATMLLMSGVNPTFVANQLGHSLTMLITRYARWINSDMDKMELEKLQTN